MPVPEYIIRASIGLAIEGYRRKNGIKVVEGTLHAEKPSWLPYFNKLIREDNRDELKRLARIPAEGETSLDNIERSFDVSVTNVEIDEAYKALTSIPDSRKASVSQALNTFYIAEAGIKRNLEKKLSYYRKK